MRIENICHENVLNYHENNVTRQNTIRVLKQTVPLYFDFGYDLDKFSLYEISDL